MGGADDGGADDDGADDGELDGGTAAVDGDASAAEEEVADDEDEGEAEAEANVGGAWRTSGPCSTAPPLGSSAAKTSLRMRAKLIAPAHMAQGSSVT